MYSSPLACKAPEMVSPHGVFSFKYFTANLTSENIVLSSGFHNIEFFQLTHTVF